MQKEERAIAYTAWNGHAFFYKSVGAVVGCDEAERHRYHSRSGSPGPGRSVVATSGAKTCEACGPSCSQRGTSRRWRYRGLCEWSALRLRASGGDCVIRELCEDAQVLQEWTQRLGVRYRGQRLAGASLEVFLHLRRPQRASGPAAYVGRGWYSKPACAEMVDSGLAQWRHFRWSLEATARVDQRWLEQALQAMEEAWPEGEEHMAKLSINALVGLFARNLDLVYSMRTSNHQVDGEGCSWRQTFTDAAGRMHWDHVFVTELLSNSS